MAVYKNRGIGYQVDYRKNGKRYRYQISDEKEAKKIVSEINKELRKMKDEKNRIKLLDTL